MNVVQETMCDHALATMSAEIRRKLGSPAERSSVPQILPYHAAYFLQAASIQAMFAAQLNATLSAEQFVDAVRFKCFKLLQLLSFHTVSMFCTRIVCSVPCALPCSAHTCACIHCQGPAHCQLRLCKASLDMRCLLAGQPTSRKRAQSAASRLHILSRRKD